MTSRGLDAILGKTKEATALIERRTAKSLHDARHLLNEVIEVLYILPPDEAETAKRAWDKASILLDDVAVSGTVTDGNEDEEVDLEEPV